MLICRNIPLTLQFLIILVLSITAPGFVFGADHYGDILEDEIWTVMNGPHNVINLVTVVEGVTLTIEDGVEVVFSGNGRIVVKGNLMALGSPDSGVHFFEATANPWFGLIFEGIGNGTFVNCLIEHANIGIKQAGAGRVRVFQTIIQIGITGIQATSGTVEMLSATIKDQSYSGFSGDGVMPALLDDNNVIENCQHGFKVVNVDIPSFTTGLTVRNCTSSGVHFEDCRTLFIDNLVLENNQGKYGPLALENCGEFLLGDNNVIGGPGKENSWPLTIIGGSYPGLGCEIPTTGNSNSGIQVRGGGIFGFVHWRPISDLPYVITFDVGVAAGGELVIEDGVSVEGGVGSGINTYGVLTAIGSPEEGVRMAGWNGDAWGGLVFKYGGGGVLENCVVENAWRGIEVETTGTVQLKNSAISQGYIGILLHSGRVELADISISNQSGYGIQSEGGVPVLLDGNTVLESCTRALYLEGVSNFEPEFPLTVRGASYAGVVLEYCQEPTVDQVIVEDCQGDIGAIHVLNSGEFTLGPGCVIGGAGHENSWPISMDFNSFPGPDCNIPDDGNTNNSIRIVGGSSNRDISWPAIGNLDYLISETLTVAMGDTLTVHPGVEARFEAGSGLEIQGTLSAVGLLQEPILFSDTGRGWDGIALSGLADGVMDHCRIESGQTCLVAGSSGQLSLSNITIIGGAYGLSTGLDSNVDWSSLTVADQIGTGISCTGTLPLMLDRFTVIDNCKNGMKISNIPNLSFATPVTIRNSRDYSPALEIVDCPSAYVDNLVFENNTGTKGAIFLDGCGEFTLGPGNSIGGPGLENSWPVVARISSFPSANCVIPPSGNTHNEILISDGSTGDGIQWRKFPGVDFAVGRATILASGELLIHQGVNVRLTGGPLTINGNLIAVGAPDEIISFLSYNSGWESLRFMGDGRGTLENCLVQDTFQGVLMRSSGHVSLVSTIIKDGSYGVQVDSGSVSFRNTKIVNNHFRGVFINGGTVDFGGDLNEWNDIYGNPQAVFNNSPDVNIGWVYWGTMSQVEIEGLIYDRNDNPSLGRVNFDPFTNEGHDLAVSGVGDQSTGNSLPKRTEIFQNFPNPFNSLTNIAFNLSQALPVQIEVFDVDGASVAIVLEGELKAGRHTAPWSGTDQQGRPVPSGVYFFRFTAGEYSSTKRMLLVK